MNKRISEKQGARETVFTAFPSAGILGLYPEFQHFYNEFVSAAKPFIRHIPLDIPDIWVRDFLPVQNTSTLRRYLFYYEPSYRITQYRKWYALLRKATAELFTDAEKIPLRLDGGNLVFSRNGLCLLFRKRTLCTPPSDEPWGNGTQNTAEETEENAHIKKETQNAADRNSYSRNGFERAEKLLKKNLFLSRIIWLPPLPAQYDPFCHADGFIQFLGNNKVCISAPYDSLTEKHLKKCLKLLPEKLKVIILPSAVNAEETLSAKGIYVNFLETSGAVFVPAYNIGADEKAAAVLRANTDKPVIKIDCGGIARYGGSLHCLTQTAFI